MVAILEVNFIILILISLAIKAKKLPSRQPKPVCKRATM
jgi:hypothetical protein